MKKYSTPTIEIVDLQSRQNMADVNPVNAITVTAGGKVTTVYNLALMGGSSVPKAGV